MGDLQDLLQSLLKKLGPPKEEEVTSKVYADEPIIMTASQMKQYTPPKYRDMRKIARSRGYYFDADAKLFYEQAKFMEDFEDHFEYRGEFSRYYPTYQVMNDLQLRGYFSWRTDVRSGKIEKTFLSFVFVYIYELLNGIGVTSEEEGFHALKGFWEAYRDHDAHVDMYMKLWLKDYVVYHGLDKALLAGIMDTGFDESLMTLLRPETHQIHEVFEALNTHSSYNLENSRFYKKYPDDMETVVYRVFLQLSEYYNRRRKNNLCEKFFGKMLPYSYTMFQSAVVYLPKRHPDGIYEINEIHRYVCKNGLWGCEQFFWNGGKSQEIGALLKNIDFYMRDAYHFKSTLKEAKSTKLFLETIQTVIQEYEAEKKRNAKPKIDIDLSKLQGIRKTSLETQSKLLVEEEPEAVETVPEPVLPANETNLDDGAYRFLQCLLYDQPYQDAVRESGRMLSVLVDSVNESLMDVIGDTVLLLEGDEPELIEDYIDELKGIIKE